MNLAAKKKGAQDEAQDWQEAQVAAEVAIMQIIIEVQPARGRGPDLDLVLAEVLVEAGLQKEDNPLGGI